MWVISFWGIQGEGNRKQNFHFLGEFLKEQLRWRYHHLKKQCSGRKNWPPLPMDCRTLWSGKRFRDVNLAYSEAHLLASEKCFSLCRKEQAQKHTGNTALSLGYLCFWPSFLSFLNLTLGIQKRFIYYSVSLVRKNNQTLQFLDLGARSLNAFTDLALWVYLKDPLVSKQLQRALETKPRDTAITFLMNLTPIYSFPLLVSTSIQFSFWHLRKELSQVLFNCIDCGRSLETCVLEALMHPFQPGNTNTVSK